MAAKNKGQITMYFLTGIKPKYSIQGMGRVPNEEFHKIYEKIARGAKISWASEKSENSGLKQDLEFLTRHR